MVYETYEEGVENGQPVELYVLALGSEIWRMHNSIDATISYAGDDYLKTIISREAIVSDADNLQITLPADHGYSSQHVIAAPGQVATLAIMRYHRADAADVKTIFKGAVRAVSYSKNAHETMLNVMPLAETFDKTIPDRTFQSSCNHVLYDTPCSVALGLFTFSGTPSAAVTNIITVPGLTAAKGNGWATAGYVSFGILDFRLVIRQDNDDCYLVQPFYETVVGQTVEVYAGCDHLIATCAAKFANSINFGGTPFVPTKNIFETGL